MARYVMILRGATSYSAIKTTGTLIVTMVLEIHISRLRQQSWSLESSNSLSKVYIQDLRLRFG
jgi:hypothetical protein